MSIGCDIIVKTDLAKLYEVDIENFSLAGVVAQGIDETIKNNKKLCHYYESVNMPVSTYVNADVLIFNLKKIRAECSLPNRAIEYLKNHPDTPMLEQDAFNIIFKDDILLLPERYNLYARRPEKIDEIIHRNQDYIIHFVGRQKPWNEHTSRYDMSYWHYLYKTPWGEEDLTFSYVQNGNFTPDKIIDNIDEYIWRRTLPNKIISLWKLTIPLYFKILKRYYQDFKR